MSIASKVDRLSKVKATTLTAKNPAKTPVLEDSFSLTSSPCFKTSTKEDPTDLSATGQHLLHKLQPQGVTGTGVSPNTSQEERVPDLRGRDKEHSFRRGPLTNTQGHGSGTQPLHSQRDSKASLDNEKQGELRMPVNSATTVHLQNIIFAISFVFLHFFHIFSFRLNVWRYLNLQIYSISFLISPTPSTA
jgi:hypothetical protein